MTRLESLRRCIAAGVLFLCGPLVPVAEAWQCMEIVEYADTWPDGDANSAWLVGRGIADGGGEPCGVTVRTYMLSPSMNELASSYGSGMGHAESTVLVYLDQNSENGDYRTSTEAWSQGIHYGCAHAPLATWLLTIGNCYHGGAAPNGNQRYHRCEFGGPCSTLDVPVSTSAPPFAKLIVGYVRYGLHSGAHWCWGGIGYAIASCAGAP